jgi:methylenetetrahydrofolate--tRNA-(uracil-5-)-methyltransferase
MNAGKNRVKTLKVVGGGLAGAEAAWQAAIRGISVELFEMRPGGQTGAHQTVQLAELVCSNSLGSKIPDRASGLLKEELRCLGSMLLEVAEEAAIPAGGALAVDREAFSRRVTERIDAHPNIRVIREEVTTIPVGPAVIASGPLTSPSLSQAIAALTGEQHLFFFDAIAPIVVSDSIDRTIAFRASRYDRSDDEEGDYLNCPLDKAEYDRFIDALIGAERIALRSFESGLSEGVRAGAGEYFEGCLPVEVLAARGRQALSFGPMRPVGLRDPRTGKRPYAIVQLRQDNLAGSLYNIVGFQTNLTYAEQKRVLRLIPGLGTAEFARFGQMHRNTFMASPRLLKPTLQYRDREDLFFAGQITGVEGYMGNIATGLLAGVNSARTMNGSEPVILPETTMLGALCRYITQADLNDFQPMKSNFGLMPALVETGKLGKRERASAYSKRALEDMQHFVSSLDGKAALDGD